MKRSSKLPWKPPSPACDCCVRVVQVQCISQFLTPFLPMLGGLFLARPNQSPAFRTTRGWTRLTMGVLERHMDGDLWIFSTSRPISHFSMEQKHDISRRHDFGLTPHLVNTGSGRMPTIYAGSSP